MKTNITMLYGHIETFEHRVDHMLRVREQQDETEVPGVHPARLPPRRQRDASCRADGRPTICAPRGARLMLDNVAHIKAYWVSTARVAQIALRFGADDLDGTVHENHLPLGRLEQPEAMTPATDRAADPRGRAAAPRARHPLQRRRALMIGSAIKPDPTTVRVTDVGSGFSGTDIAGPVLGSATSYVKVTQVGSACTLNDSGMVAV